jgi:hypothetical protein
MHRRAICRNEICGSASYAVDAMQPINRERGTIVKTGNKKVKSLARDLSREFPRSPRETLGGYVLAARCLDKCRAVLAGTAGEYHYNCGLDQMWLKFAQVDPAKFQEFVATGASDEAVSDWIVRHARKRPRSQVVKWNNKMRDLRLSDLPVRIQMIMEDYIPQFLPKNRPVYHWFDVYDIEEGRI